MTEVKPRFDYVRLAAGGYQAMLALETYLHASGSSRRSSDLVKLRVSQINGCAYCIDVHSKDLRARGETEQRLYGLDAWRECPYYSDRERAALAWAEAITTLVGHVPDAVYDEVRAQFDEQSIAALTFVAAAINAWNRIAIPSRQTPGRYRSRVATTTNP